MNQRKLDILTLLAKTKAEELVDGFDLQMAGERVNYGDTTGNGRIGGGSEPGVTEDITQEEEAAAGIQALIGQVTEAAQTG